MAKAATGSFEDTAEVKGGEVVGLSPQAIQQYESLLAAIPDAGGSGYEGILAAIASAQSPADLDAPWRSTDTNDLVGLPLSILAVSKSPSDFGGGLAFFLVVQAVDVRTGEPVTFTTGAVGIVAQLAKAYAMGALPLHATIREAASRREGRNPPQYLSIDK